MVRVRILSDQYGYTMTFVDTQVGRSAQIASSGPDVQSEDGCTVDRVTDLEHSDIVRIMLS